MKELTMEQIFVVTYLCTMIVGVGLGFLIYWIFENDNNKGETK